jgi:FkbM family methyltransferase
MTKATVAADAARLTDEEVIRSFPLYPGPVEPGFIIDFLGTRTLHAFCDHLPAEGHVGEYPIPMDWHATMLEWAGTLRAVLEAGPEAVAVELGAGWGPWLVTFARAAARRGAKVHLIGVEGSRKHCGFMRRHFQENGLSPDEHTLLHGIAGARDGVAYFPELGDETQYGGVADFKSDPPLGWLYRRWRGMADRLLGRRAEAAPPGHAAVRCYSLDRLLRPHPRIDLIHIDIQGAEYDVLAAASSLHRKARRLVIGTHSYEIEAQLQGELGRHGWELESAEECVYQHGALWRDGCQVWRNPRVKPAGRLS